jgi:HxlR-like helix-turn-helix
VLFVYSHAARDRGHTLGMKPYGQFCPVAKAAEILGDRWTLLIVRELTFGTLGFNELARGLPGISDRRAVPRLHGTMRPAQRGRRRSARHRGRPCARESLPSWFTWSNFAATVRSRTLDPSMNSRNPRPEGPS